MNTDNEELSIRLAIREQREVVASMWAGEELELDNFKGDRGQMVILASVQTLEASSMALWIQLLEETLADCRFHLEQSPTLKKNIRRQMGKAEKAAGN